MKSRVAASAAGSLSVSSVFSPPAPSPLLFTSTLPDFIVLHCTLHFTELEIYVLYFNLLYSHVLYCTCSVDWNVLTCFVFCIVVYCSLYCQCFYAVHFSALFCTVSMSIASFNKKQVTLCEVGAQLFGPLILQIFGHLILHVFGHLILQLCGRLILQISDHLVLQLCDHLILQICRHLILQIWGHLILRIYDHLIP